MGLMGGFDKCEREREMRNAFMLGLNVQNPESKSQTMAAIGRRLLERDLGATYFVPAGCMTCFILHCPQQTRAVQSLAMLQAQLVPETIIEIYWHKTTHCNHECCRAPGP